MTKAIFGLVANQEQANRVIDSLLSAGFVNDDISVLYPDSNKGAIRTNEHGNVEYKDTDYPNSNATNPNAMHTRHDAKGHLTTEKNTKAPEGGVAGAATGGIHGGSLGLLAGIGALSIPGLGAFIAAGPIMAALSGTAVGGSVGLLLGALVGSGIPEYEAKKYEAGLKAGNILISVHTDDDNELKRAHEILKKENVKDISSSQEKAGNAY